MNFTHFGNNPLPISAANATGLRRYVR
jgi:hypothetical protein